jgi:hypothetical protein
MDRRTLAITIYRQKLLWDLDFWDLPHTSNIVFAMILSLFETAVMVIVACIPLMRPLFSKSGTNSPPNGLHNRNNQGKGVCLEKGNKRKGVRNMQLLYPPSWFDNNDDWDAKPQSLEPVHVAKVASSSSADISLEISCLTDSSGDKKRWEAPETWHTSTRSSCWVRSASMS